MVKKWVWSFWNAAILVVVVSLLASCAAPATSTTPPGVGIRITNLSVSQAYDLVKTNSGKTDFQIIDVRTPEEFQGGHLEGALNIDIYSADFESRLRQLNMGRQYLVYCRTGVRSAQASQTMANLGFARIFNMQGGISDWAAAGYPVTK